MQIVKYGKKQRQVKVPAGWKFLKNGTRVASKDKFFNVLKHTWDDVEEDDFGDVVGELFAVVIRNDLYSEDEVDKDPHAVRIVE